MGFQTGSQIRPELGNADYSGFANAANIQAQAMSDLGSQIGGAIKEYSKKKEEKILTGQAAELLAGLPGASDLGITDKETALVAIKSLGGAGNALTALSALRQGEANVEATRQATSQSKSMFNPKLAMANLGVETAQQAYDYNEAMNPLRLDSQNIMNKNALQAFDIAAQKEMRAAGMYPVELRGKQQNIAASISSINNAEKKLALETRKIKLLEEQAKANSTNEQVQANMIQMVLDGDMSNKEYINAGGDMDTLRKATELTEGQTARGNADMIAAVKEVNPNYRYNPETNDWTDTSGINEDGIQWSDPRIKRILGTRESQVMGNAGWGVVGNISN